MKVRDKDTKSGLRSSRGGMEKAVSPGMRKSRHDLVPRSPHKDYSNY